MFLWDNFWTTVCNSSTWLLSSACEAWSVSTWEFFIWRKLSLVAEPNTRHGGETRMRIDMAASQAGCRFSLVKEIWSKVEIWYDGDRFSRVGSNEGKWWRDEVYHRVVIRLWYSTGSKPWWLSQQDIRTKSLLSKGIHPNLDKPKTKPKLLEKTLFYFPKTISVFTMKQMSFL